MILNYLAGLHYMADIEKIMKFFKKLKKIDLIIISSFLL